jgi:anti-anti-sigma regulatory factor
MEKWAVGVQHEGPRGRLSFPANITGQARENAFRAYDELARAAVKEVCLDFSLTEYITSRGFGLIISLVEAAIQDKCQVYTYGLTSHYARLFNMVGLAERAKAVVNPYELTPTATG